MINDNETTSPLQRVLIGVGTLIVVVLTIIAAIFLTVQNQGEGTPIAEATSTPTPVEDGPSVIPVATSTFTPTPSPTTSPSPTTQLTHTPELLPSPTETLSSEAEPTVTFTPEPIATFTATPVVVPPTFTPVPVPVATTNCGTPAPEGWVTYQVQTGDTFNSLATRTGISVFTLQQANCLTGNLQNGQILYLPFTPPTPTPLPTPTATGTVLPTLTPTPTPFVPIITSVSPSRVDSGYSDDVIITIIGRNFDTRAAGFRAELRGPQNVLLALLGPGSDTSFDAIVPVGLPSGSYDVVVTNPDDRATSKPLGFVIGQVTPTPFVPGPEITEVIPDRGFRDRENIIEVRGINFRPNDPGLFRVELRMGDRVEASLTLVGTATSTSFNARVPANITAGIYDLWVINPDGKDDVEPAAYEAVNP
jgi:LysM repeat protein